MKILLKDIRDQTIQRLQINLVHLNLLNLFHIYLNELEYQNIENYIIEGLPKGNSANNYGKYKGSMSNHDKIYENIVDVLQNNKTISTNAFEGLKTVEIIEKIYKEIR